MAKRPELAAEGELHKTTYTITHTVKDGIERIVYMPEVKRFKTPILMQHGMWHGAWCWQSWQELFAEWSWESIAISLPGHGQSPVQRPIRWCTLGYYLKFLAAEIEQLQQRTLQRPILMGHSMGGALTQWVLKYVGDLPAAVLVAPWTSHNMLGPVFRFSRLDPIGFLLCILTLTTTPNVHTPQRAAKMLSPRARSSPPKNCTPDWAPNRCGCCCNTTRCSGRLPNAPTRPCYGWLGAATCSLPSPKSAARQPIMALNTWLWTVPGTT